MFLALRCLFISSKMLWPIFIGQLIFTVALTVSPFMSPFNTFSLFCPSVPTFTHPNSPRKSVSHFHWPVHIHNSISKLSLQVAVHNILPFILHCHPQVVQICPLKLWHFFIIQLIYTIVLQLVHTSFGSMDLPYPCITQSTVSFQHPPA